MTDSSGKIRTLKIPVANTLQKSYLQRDTLLTQQKYTVQLFTSNTTNSDISGNFKKHFTGAFRSENYKIYYYNALNETEILTVDLAALKNDLFIKLSKGLTTFSQVYTEVVKDAKKETKSAASKSLAIGLMELMFLLR